MERNKAFCLTCNKQLGEIGKEIKGTYQIGRGRGLELLSFCCREHGKVYISKNPELFETLKKDNENYERKKQEILSKIFVGKEERLKHIERKLEELKEKKEYYYELDKVNSELKEKITDIDEQIGRIFRKYETEMNISEKEKIFMRKIWEYISNEIPKEFKIPLTKYERKKHLSLKMRRHKEALEKLRIERRDLNINQRGSKR